MKAPLFDIFKYVIVKHVYLFNNAVFKQLVINTRQYEGQNHIN